MVIKYREQRWRYILLYPSLSKKKYYTIDIFAVKEIRIKKTIKKDRKTKII